MRFRQALIAEEANFQLVLGACCGALFVVLLALIFLSGCARVPLLSGRTRTEPWDAGSDIDYCHNPNVAIDTIETRRLLCGPQTVQEVAP